jgi:glycosyltransferase involved in cell wall biosynthesis
VAGQDSSSRRRRSPDEQLRVLMVTPRYLPLVGGVELHVDQVSRRLAASGMEITILTTDPTATLPAHERVNGIAVRRVRAWPANRDYYFAPDIWMEISRGDWDIVHVQSFHTLVAPLAMLAARRSRIPYVVTFHAGGHSSSLRNALRPVQLALMRPLLARANCLIALASFEIDQYASPLRVPPERFVLIPNGSDLPGPGTFASVPGEPALIASVGRLERYKGHHRVVAALPHVLRRRPEARLWLAGTGPYERSLRQLAESLGVSERVEIRAVPIEEREQMAHELSRVKVVVNLSEFETQPIAALEALALGCRLIVADTPGLRPLADESLARSVPLASSPEHVAAAVLEEMDRPAPAPPKLPTWDDCAERHLALYLTLLPCAAVDGHSVRRKKAQDLAG